jgi:hypothetical protein
MKMHLEIIVRRHGDKMNEEIQKIKTKVRGIMQKTTKTGKPYWELDTEYGPISFFDGGLADLIEKRQVVGKSCELGLKENKGYMNLYSVESVGTDLQTADFYKQTGLKEQKWGRSKEEKDSIVAQCLVKIAADLTRGQMEIVASKNGFIEVETEMLSNTKIALTCYQKALEELGVNNEG